MDWHCENCNEKFSASPKAHHCPVCDSSNLKMVIQEATPTFDNPVSVTPESEDDPVEDVPVTRRRR